MSLSRQMHLAMSPHQNCGPQSTAVHMPTLLVVLSSMHFFYIFQNHMIVLLTTLTLTTWLPTIQLSESIWLSKGKLRDPGLLRCAVAAVLCLSGINLSGNLEHAIRGSICRSKVLLTSAHKHLGMAIDLH